MKYLLSSGKIEKYNIEYTIHDAPKTLAKQINRIFSNYYKNIKIIISWQKANISILELGENVNTERDKM